VDELALQRGEIEARHASGEDVGMPRTQPPPRRLDQAGSVASVGATGPSNAIRQVGVEVEDGIGHGCDDSESTEKMAWNEERFSLWLHPAGLRARTPRHPAASSDAGRERRRRVVIEVNSRSRR
jgi:hypothetical protein